MPRGPGPLAVPGQAFNPLPGEEPRRAAFLEHESGLLLFLLGWSRGGGDERRPKPKEAG